MYDIDKFIDQISQKSKIKICDETNFQDLCLGASWLQAHKPANVQQDQQQFNQKRDRM